MSIGIPANMRTSGSGRSAVPTRGASQPQRQSRTRLRARAWIALVLLLPAALIIGAIKQSNTHSTANRADAYPARIVLQPRTVTRAAQVGALRARLTVYPLIPGANHFALSLRDGDGPLTAATVTLRATMPGMLMRPIRYVAARAGAGRYSASGPLPMFGHWRIVALVAQPRARPIEAIFDISLDLPAGLFASQAGAGGH